MKSILYFFAASLLFLASCTEDDDNNPQDTLASVTISDLPADPYTGIDPATMRPTGDKGIYTFFRFADSSVVANADSATTRWDIAFKGSTILVNNGTSGPGQGGAFIYNGIFSELLEVPADSTFKIDNAPNYAVDRSWYVYNAAAMVFTPAPGKVLVIRTADGKFAKLEILSYYKGAPASPTVRDESRYYKFRYVYQADGSKKFK